MVEICAGGPKELPRKRIELRAGSSGWKPSDADGDVALENLRVAPLHFSCWRSGHQHARHIGGAVQILRSTIDQINLVRAQRPRGGPFQPIMRVSGVAGRSRDGGKAEAAKILTRPAKLGKLLCRRPFRLVSRRGFGDPSEETHHGSAIS